MEFIPVIFSPTQYSVCLLRETQYFLHIFFGDERFVQDLELGIGHCLWQVHRVVKSNNFSLRTDIDLTRNNELSSKMFVKYKQHNKKGVDGDCVGID